MAETNTSPKPVERPASRVVITDEMMLKAVSMANQKDKVESKVRLSLSQLAISNGNPASRPGTATKTAHKETTPASGDLNGNTGKMGYEENCPFDIICDFLQAVMQKKYKEALDICKTILLYEPDNGIANEFRDVLEEMVKEEGDSAKEEDEASAGEENSESSDDLESSSGDSAYSDEIGDGDGDTTDCISDTSSASSENGVEEVNNDALNKFFGVNDSSSGDEEPDSDEDGDDTTTSGSSGSSCSSSSSSSDSSTESEDASDIADLLMAGAYGHHRNQDDTFDMISSLDCELDESYAESGAVGGSHLEDLGEVNEEGKGHGLF